ncbi:hypothetical protein [Thalassospira xiamenensis]|uniref:hypothetical protein n=1 Tax=Thalassospira xiamenensis TaxID=220697 RepID=UPI000DED3EAD|nr:hypothetical protein [Thalassospira xiamenensis]RCK40477.1 hypothetical protein TH24_11110 [Thalassospira xiamenensis]
MSKSTVPLNQARQKQPANENTPVQVYEMGESGIGVRQPSHSAGPCPIKFLGVNKGMFYVINANGELDDVSRSQIGSRSVLKSLFGERNDWLDEAFPKLDKDGEVSNRPVLQVNDASDWVIAECSKMGLFQPDMVRGRGVWRDIKGGLIVHCGDVLFLSSGKEMIRAGEVLADGWVYPARAPIPRGSRPDLDNPATVKQMQMVKEHIESWRFSTKADPVICLGIMGLICVTGALERRPTLWLCGPASAGKSSLLDFLTLPIGGGKAAEKTSDATAAYVRGRLNGAALPIFMDEMEPESGKAGPAMELARLAFSDDQGGVGRSSASQETVLQQIIAQFVFSSIKHPEPGPQDAQRIHFVTLRERAVSQEATERFRDRRDHLKALGPRIWSRMILGFGRFRTNLAVFEGVLGGATYTSRLVDRMAPVLAAYETLMHDDVITSTVAREMISVLDLDEAPKMDTEFDQCLRKLMTSKVDVYRGGTRPTVGQLIRAVVMDNVTTDEEFKDLKYLANVFLPSMGLKLLRKDRSPASPWGYLAIASNHEQLNIIYRGSKWENGVYRQPFGCLEGAVFSKVIKFIESPCRATVVPLEYVIVPTPDGDDI